MNIAFAYIFLFVMTLVVRVPPVELDFYNRNTKELASSELYGLERKRIQMIQGYDCRYWFKMTPILVKWNKPTSII